jgi:hypothetical protein
MDTYGYNCLFVVQGTTPWLSKLLYKNPIRDDGSCAAWKRKIESARREIFRAKFSAATIADLPGMRAALAGICCCYSQAP